MTTPSNPGRESEKEKYWAGEPFDSAKLYQEMDDSFWDAAFDGLRQKPDQAKPPTARTNPSSESDRPV